MSLGYTAHSIWDSSYKQIGKTQKKKKIYIYIRYFKFQTENYVYLKLSISQCMSVFLDNMKLMSSI